MLNFMSKIQESLSGKDDEKQGVAFNFIKDKQSILKELTNSFKNGTLIGVYSRELGEGMFLTGVDDMQDSGSFKYVVFETYDICGKALNKTKISIDEIRMVCPFKTEYVNPLLRNVTSVKPQR